MLLYLLRHGDSQSDASIPDEDRALTPAGIASVQKAARTIQRLNLTFDAVYASPLLRARQTAQHVVNFIGHSVQFQTTECLIVGSDFRMLFELLKGQSAHASVLLIGHEPFLSRLVSTLVAGDTDAKVDIRKASLCCVEVSQPVGAGTGVLRWLVPSQMME